MMLVVLTIARLVDATQVGAWNALLSERQEDHGALANWGHQIDAITVRHILRRHSTEPPQQRWDADMSWAQLL